MRDPQARSGRGNLTTPFIASMFVAVLLVPTQRVEAQGATSVEIVANSYTDTIAVRLDASGNPAILFDGKKASCADRNCSFPAIDSFFDDFPNIQIETRRVSFDAQGYPYLRFGSKYASNRILDTLVRCLDPDCESVTTHEIPELPSPNFMALRNDRLAMFLFQNQGTDKLKLATCVDLVCTWLTTFSTIAAEGLPAAIDIDNDGNPIIVFSLDGVVGWSIARCYDLACSSPVITPLDVARPIRNISIKVNSSDEPVLSFINQIGHYNDADLRLLQCADPNCETSSTRIIDNARAVAAMEFDDNDLPVLAFRKAGTIRLARCLDGACASLSVEVVDSATGGPPTLAIDELGHPVLAYRDARLDKLKLARCGNPGCSASVGVVPDPGTYYLRSVVTHRYLDADPNGSVATSLVPKPDDVWNLDLAIANSSLPLTLANNEYVTSLENNDWIPEDAGDGTFYLRRVSDASQNYLSASGRELLFTTRDQSDRWEFIPVDETRL